MADLQSDTFDWQPRLSERALLGSMVFDIAKAKELIKATPHPVEEKPLSTFKPAYYLLSIKIDWEKAKTTDLKFPVIAAIIDNQPTIIDGWHRYASALKQNLPTLPTVMLTPEELAQVKKR